MSVEYQTSVVEAAEAVRLARVRYAEAYIRFRPGSHTDATAHQRAIIETNDELTVLQADLWAAKMAAQFELGYDPGA
jgi:hypothetical protein